MSGLMSDREPFPDEDDPANNADLLGQEIDPEGYFSSLNGFLHHVAEQATAEGLVAPDSNPGASS